MSTNTIDLGEGLGHIQGHCADQFAAVLEVFKENFQKHGEVGASVCVTLNGETVVDLWGGAKDRKGETPWEQDTVSVVYSSTKGAVALAAHTLIDAGELDLNKPVKYYWPEFACNGKESATVRMMLNHTAGVPCNREPLEDCTDWDYMVQRIAEEEAFWKPGTRNGYHMMNFGWTVGELIRRVSGQSLGAYFRSAVAEPAGAEFWIGLPEELEDRVAPMMQPKLDKSAPLSEFSQALIGDRQSIQNLALFNNGGFNPNKRKYHAAEIGGGGGIGNARGLAAIYAPFACRGTLKGRRYVSEETVTRMAEISVATEEDATLLLPTRFGLGFMKSMDNRVREAVDRSSAILSSSAFGHPGAGGSIGFADPVEQMSFGYTMNQMGPGILLNQRGQGLIDATYRALGYAGNDAGVWHR